MNTVYLSIQWIAFIIAFVYLFSSGTSWKMKFEVEAIWRIANATFYFVVGCAFKAAQVTQVIHVVCQP